MTGSDEQLISDYLKGDEKALEKLIERHIKPLYGFVYQFVRSQQDAEDITQNTLLKAWQNLSKFNKDKKFKTWLFTIAKNTAFDFLKKSRSALGGKKMISFSTLTTDEENMLLEKLVDPAPLPDEILERADIAQALDAALAKLPVIYQTVLYLYYKNELNFREIAEITQEPIDTIKSRHRRALIALRKLLIA